MNLQAFKRRLVTRGFDRIGSGYYSYVFAKPGSDRCIKVSSGDNWPDYIKWGMDNGYAGTFTPKVYSLKNVKCGQYEKDYYIAVVERMQSLDLWRGNKLQQNLRAYIEHGDNAALFTCPEDWKAFARHARIAGMVDDLKAENWLQRTDGSLCLNDPVCGDHLKFRGRIKNGLTVEPKPLKVAAQPFEPQYVFDAVGKLIPWETVHGLFR
jgi:hypothetical protein